MAKAKRQIVHPKPVVKIHEGLTALEAKKLLGWKEEGASTFGDNYLFKDTAGEKVRCDNNVRNRPFYSNNMEKLRQEILRGRWGLNLENRIIGKTGLVLNGQHTLVALVLAVQLWEKDPEAYPTWKSEPTIATSIGYGVSEDDTTVNTMDTCKPRSLADVYYRSDLLKNTSLKDRKNLSRILEYGVRFLWYRTGVVQAFNPALKDTHAELIDFGRRHPKILDCAKHIYEENGKENKINPYLRCGYATGLLYLMGSSATDSTAYRKEQEEKHLDWSNWDKACDFFVLLAGDSEELAAIKTVLRKIYDDDASSLAAHTALIAKAWNLYVTGKDVTQKDIALKFVKKDDWPVLAECPDVCGIDLGDPANNEDFQGAKIEEEKAIIREERESKKRSAKKATKTAKKKTAKSTKTTKSKLVGKTMWVVNGVDDPWRGKVMSAKGKSAEVKVGQGFQGSGNVKPVAVAHLRQKQPLA